MGPHYQPIPTNNIVQLVTPEVFSRTTQLTPAVSASVLGDPINVNEQFHALSGNAGQNYQVESERVGNGFDIFVQGPTGQVKFRIELDENGSIAKLTMAGVTGTYRAAYLFLKLYHSILKAHSYILRTPLTFTQFLRERFKFRLVNVEGLAEFLEDFQLWTQKNFAPIFELPITFTLSFMPRAVIVFVAKRHSVDAQQWQQRVKRFDQTIRSPTLGSISQNSLLKVFVGITLSAPVMVFSPFLNIDAPNVSSLVTTLSAVLFVSPFLWSAAKANIFTHRAVNANGRTRVHGRRITV